MNHRRSFLSAAAALTLALAATAPAQDEKPPDPSDVADGMRLFETKGNCQIHRSGERFTVEEALTDKRVDGHPKRLSYQCYYGTP